MNKRVTSTEQILQTALELAMEKGLDRLSIRTLAQACGIAIGSIYNYYPNKEALVTAVGETFWNRIFADQEKVYHPLMRFTDFLEQYYAYLYARMAPYDRSWVRDLEGRIPMEETMELFARVLKSDPKVDPSIWNMDFLPEDFCLYVFRNLMALLQSGESNCRFFLYLLENLLYE